MHGAQPADRGARQIARYGHQTGGHGRRGCRNSDLAAIARVLPPLALDVEHSAFGWRAKGAHGHHLCALRIVGWCEHQNGIARLWVVKGHTDHCKAARNPAEIGYQRRLGGLRTGVGHLGFLLLGALWRLNASLSVVGVAAPQD